MHWQILYGLSFQNLLIICFLVTTAFQKGILEKQMSLLLIVYHHLIVVLQDRQRTNFVIAINAWKRQDCLQKNWNFRKKSLA